MITYSARTVDGEMITVQCVSRDAALDLAEGDLRNGMMPTLLELYGVRLSVAHILRLVFKRWAEREQQRGVQQWQHARRAKAPQNVIVLGRHRERKRGVRLS